MFLKATLNALVPKNHKSASMGLAKQKYILTGKLIVQMNFR